MRHGVTGNWNGIYCDILMGIGLYRAVNWWLRSPNSSNNYIACRVSTGGSVITGDGVYYGYSCARPALALSSEILVSDSADSSGCYTIASAPAGEEYQKVNGVWMRMC